MNKRGQFTLFVVLGILIVLLIGLLFIFKDDILGFTGISKELSYPSEIQEVVEHVQECVDASAYEAVINIGYTGGYYTLPEQSYVADSYAVPYYLYDGEDLTLSSEQLTSELNDYITALVNSCVNVEQFPEFTISTGEASADVDIEQNIVSVVVKYPLTVSVAESSYSLTDSYETFVEAKLGWVYGIATQIVDADIANPDEIDYTTLLSYGVASIIVAPVDNFTYVYVLQDTTSFGGEQNMTFLFAEHYVTLVSDAECFIDLDCADGYICEEEMCVEEEE
ncbi:MAG: hypothetical protein Q8R18_03535 [bacterium]|nr:hypothetical protein [bacterium]